MRIVAIVVTYNRKEFLKENIDALLGQSYSDFDILIIDNNSSDGTADLVKSYKNDRIFYINTGANIGGAGGFALGVKEAIKRGYDYCWLMDDDAIPEKDALKSILAKVKILGGKFSFINSVAKWKDGSMCVMNIPMIDREWFKKYEEIKCNLLPLKACTFVSCFVNIEIAKKVGLPIKEFFIYGDDVEYTLRLSKEEQGYLDLDSVVIHKMGLNQGTDIVTEGESRIDRYVFDFRNRFYIAKQLGKKEIIKYLIMFFITLYRIMRYSRSKKTKRIIMLG
ncbi:glycosyltransferase family 2 protein [Caldicoprobacter algeriensis]|uniref:glycosyltransferase family 2 protein n=1 Tax=Caldicoprobacter algeriensis TaxID=699281 RepID=UPI00207A1314|nr:glycosyltransferase family 2 protein [Caldicoprobacter algeriensis]MCM8901685.1 glycosyltransferase family 2 protein [Caldicoprobacter algeriensis]